MDYTEIKVTWEIEISLTSLWGVFAQGVFFFYTERSYPFSLEEWREANSNEEPTHISVFFYILITQNVVGFGGLSTDFLIYASHFTDRAIHSTDICLWQLMNGMMKHRSQVS